MQPFASSMRPHTHTHTKCKCKLSSYQSTQPLEPDSQGACALSRHYEPVQANSWNRARNSKEDWPRLSARPLADWQAMASEFVPQKIPGPHHSWVDWRGKNSQPWDCESKDITTQTLCPHNYTHTHTHTHKPFHICRYRWSIYYASLFLSPAFISDAYRTHWLLKCNLPSPPSLSVPSCTLNIYLNIPFLSAILGKSSSRYSFECKTNSSDSGSIFLMIWKYMPSWIW